MLFFFFRCIFKHQTITADVSSINDTVQLLTFQNMFESLYFSTVTWVELFFNNNCIYFGARARHWPRIVLAASREVLSSVVSRHSLGSRLRTWSFFPLEKLETKNSKFSQRNELHPYRWINNKINTQQSRNIVLCTCVLYILWMFLNFWGTYLMHNRVMYQLFSVVIR